MSVERPETLDPASLAPLEPLASSRTYDVFLTYCRADEANVRRAARRLSESGYEPWFDREVLKPGDSWIDEIDARLRQSEFCLVFVGEGVRDGWAGEELKAALDLANDAGRPQRLTIVPVVLPGVSEIDGDVDRQDWPSWLRTRQWVDLRHGVEDDEAWASLLDVLSDAPEGGPVGGPCPYPGLDPFTENESKYFLGRSSELADLLTRIQARRFLAITGASGAGKSSLVRAGLVPAIKEHTGGRPAARVVVMRPRDDVWAWLRSYLVADNVCTPTEAEMASRPGPGLRDLAIRLAPTGEMVLVVDQLEELFNQDVQAQRSFIDAILSLCGADGPARVIVTLRADFLGSAAEHPALAGALSNSQFVLSPLSGEALREAISRPAHSVGLEFHAGLVDRIMVDVESEPGSLPLLAHLLRRLWQERRRNRLTLPAYEALGGVTATLAQTADEVIDFLSPSDRALARRVLLRLTQPGDGTEDARVPARFTQLLASVDETDRVRRVIDHLATQRLVVVDAHPDGADSTIDVIHESLLRSWPRLRGWIDDRRDSLRLQRAIHLDTAAWNEHDRDESYLYRGVQLRSAADLVHADQAFLNIEEQEFVAASLGRDRAEQSRLESQRRRDAERAAQLRLRGRLIIAGAVTLLALAGLLVLADQLRRQARSSELEAQATGLAAASQARNDNQRDLALLLAVEATALQETPFSLAAMVDGLAKPSIPQLVSTTDVAVTAMDLDEGTGMVALGTAGGDVHVLHLDAASEEHTVVPLHRLSRTTGVRWLSDGRFVSAGSDGRLAVVDTATGDVDDLVPDGSPIEALTVLDDVVVAADESGLISLWPSPGQEAAARWTVPGTSELLIGADRRTLVVAAASEIWTIDLANPTAEPTRFATTDAEITALAVDRVSNGLAYGDAAGRIEQRYLDDGTARAVRLSTGFGAIKTLAFDPTGQFLLAGTAREPRVIRWNADTGEQVGTPLWRTPTGEELERVVEARLVADPVVEVVAMADGLALSAAGRSLIRWDSRPGTGLIGRRWPGAEPARWIAPTTTGEPNRSQTEPMAADPSGAVTISGTSTGRLTVSTSADGAPSAVDYDLGEAVTAVAVSHSGVAAVAASVDGRVAIYQAGHWSEFAVDGPVVAVAAADDGRVAVARGVDIEVWESTSDGPIQLTELQGHVGVVDSLVFEPGGAALVSGSDDRTIRIWNLTISPSTAQVLTGHTDRIWGLAFDPEHQFLVSASEDSTARIWAASHGYAGIGAPINFGEPLLAAAADRNGVLISHGSTVDRLDLSLDVWIERACAIAGRSLTETESMELLDGRRTTSCNPSSG